MAAARRLVTTADVGPPAGRGISVAARLELELGDGTRVLLLDDRGWASTGGWDTTTPDDVAETTRVVVGPDEPFGDRSQEDMAGDHWASLAHDARRQGADVDAAGLRALPHDVVLTPRLLARLRVG